MRVISATDIAALVDVAAVIEVVDAATLKVTGCLMMGLCESETWVRLR